MKKLTRKQAEKILERDFRCIQPDDFIQALCHCMPKELQDDFKFYWHKINNEGHKFMEEYFDDYKSSYIEDTFLRLLTAHIFIRETYE